MTVRTTSASGLESLGLGFGKSTQIILINDFEHFQLVCRELRRDLVTLICAIGEDQRNNAACGWGSIYPRGFGFS